MTGFDARIVCGSGVDTLVRVGELPLPSGGSMGMPPLPNRMAHTGNGVALGLHARGARTTFLNYVNDDEQGRMIQARHTTPTRLPHSRRGVVLVMDGARSCNWFALAHERRLAAAFAGDPQ
ncbi:hypothetical protein [Streptomyces rochei]|uniref:hypothetical protein n=1 Tax=Streptomyces rochei TaxID=1928 RepID=UPI0013B94D0F|nr:hypothetical protein [Streptomyces rochei]NEC76758.1 hypothetical protein [Streptomyces rochei]